LLNADIFALGHIEPFHGCILMYPLRISNDDSNMTCIQRNYLFSYISCTFPWLNSYISCITEENMSQFKPASVQYFSSSVLRLEILYKTYGMHITFLCCFITNFPVYWPKSHFSTQHYKSRLLRVSIHGCELQS